MAEMVPVYCSTMPDIPTPMRKYIEDEIHGYLIYVVLQKQLAHADFDGEQPRLLIPFERIQFDFLTEKECEILENKGTLHVKILDKALRVSTIGLAKCTVECRPHYCLTTNWSSFSQINKLKPEKFIQLWSFRRITLVDPVDETFSSHLWFALNKYNNKNVL